MVRTVLANYIKVIEQEMSDGSGAIPVSSQIVLKIVESECICGHTNLIIEDDDVKNKKIEKIIRCGIDHKDHVKIAIVERQKRKDSVGYLLKEKTEQAGIAPVVSFSHLKKLE